MRRMGWAMKKTSLKVISGVTLAVMSVVAPAQIAAETSGRNARGRRIEGTWRMAITLLTVKLAPKYPTLPSQG